MPTEYEDLPGTLKRSPEKAQKIYSETLDSAHESYDSEEAARSRPRSGGKEVVAQAPDADSMRRV